VAALDKSLSMVWWRWHQRFTAVLLLIYGSLFLSIIYYCLLVFCCAAARKGESQFAKTFWRGKMTFWAVSSQVMKHGSTNTALKRSGKLHNGRLSIPHDQKISVSPNQESKQCCWLFLILEGLFIMNLYQLDKESTKFTIWKYWKGCVKS